MQILKDLGKDVSTAFPSYHLGIPNTVEELITLKPGVRSIND